jgi:glycosyltransferase involved in cell wall biosynthesis
MPLISVVIPTYNRALLVRRAVESVLNQSFRDLELIVVDDGSNDNTALALEPYMDKMVFIRHERNQGVSVARNTGIKAAGGEMIAFLDSDDFWFREKLEVQELFFKANPHALICQAQEIWYRNGVRVNPGLRHIKPSGDIFIPSLKLCLVSPSAVIMRRSLLEEVGLFDEDLPVCEDYDLWLRISCRHPVHLIDRYLLARDGGRPDQLSASVPAQDRYRILSLVRLLFRSPLRPEQRSAVLCELKVRCTVYGNGCIRRGRSEEGRYYLGLPRMLEEG